MDQGNAPASPTAAMDPEDLQELRFALVMTGGVSLAVWMGGVANEFNRLLQAEGLYGELLRLTGTSPRVDVIAGASAGGLNGAFLAAAIAWNSSLAALRDIWLEKGSFDALLRPALQADAPSLLKGDEYFLPELQRAFASLRNPQRTPVKDRPIHLTITTSLLKPQNSSTDDDFGSLVMDVDHRGEFVFSRGAMSHHGTNCIHQEAKAASDDFADPEIAARLGLAARCSASFSGAFEPSFCPVGESTRKPYRPDMRCHADFEESRFTLDGGILVNRPVEPALRAVFAQPASRQVRRVLAYVVPDSGESADEEPDVEKRPPGIGKVLLGSLVTLPRSESISRELGALREHNRRVGAVRRSRELSLTLPDIEGRAVELFNVYLDNRARESVAHIVGQIAAGLADPALQTRSPLWNRDTLTAVLAVVRRNYLPNTLPDDPLADVWRWGIRPVEDVASTTLDLLRRSLELAAPNDAAAMTNRRSIRAARDAVSNVLTQVSEIRRRIDDQYWRQQASAALTALRGGTEPTRAWALDAFEGWTGSEDELRTLAVSVAETLAHAAAPLRSVVSDIETSSSTGKRAMKAAAGALRLMLERLIPADAGNDAGSVLRRLLALHVVDVAFGDGNPPVDQYVELLNMSAEASNGFDDRTQPRQKLAGIQLGHFGAFYKRSWRANDWMWGRLDAARHLATVLVDPRRLRQLGLSVGDAVAHMEEMALGSDPAARALLSDGSPLGWSRDEALAELSYLDSPTAPTPRTLPACARALSRRLQIDILRNEIPVVAKAIRIDVRAGAAKRASAETFADDALEAGEPPIAPDKAIALFRDCFVGQELLTEEAYSDLFASTVATTGAVVVSTLQSKQSPLGRMKAVLRPLRGVALALYVMAKGAVSRSKFGFASMLSMLVIGSALLAVTTLADQPPPGLVTTIGAILVAAGLSHAALRAGVWRMILAILPGALVALWPTIAPPLARRIGDGDEWWREAVGWSADHLPKHSALFVVGGFVIGALILGYVRQSPRASTSRSVRVSS